MAEAENPIEAAILAPPESTASTLFGVYDGLAAAGREWEFIVNGAMGTPLFTPRILAREGQLFQTGAGVRVHPHGAYEDVAHPRVVVIPDVLVGPHDDLHGRFDPEIAWLRRWYQDGALIATACTGALLLAEAGLLDGLQATIHWGYCDAMARRFPRITVRSNCALVVTGDQQRLVMAGGGSSWQDLTLYLIARLTSVEEAMRVARLYLIDWHHVGQQPFATVALQNSRDAAIARSQQWIAHHYDHAAPVSAMAHQSGLAERSFKRRFVKATGLAPLEYVHTLRLEEAKQMLEGGAESVESIANQVGYEDASFFSRLFRRRVGITPAEYRKRFRGLRQVLVRETTATLGRSRPGSARARSASKRWTPKRSA
jgi:transcriptional regulator GlxA family with amidase domain